MSRREPEKVFTPNAVATLDMFERRNEPDRSGNPGLQDRLVESIRQPGAQLRVFGETGVGKTSLVAFAAAETGRTILTVECRTSQDFSDIVEQAISRIQGVRLISFVKHHAASAEVEAGGKLGFLASIKGKVSGEKGKERAFEVVQKSPLDLLVDLMSEQGYSLLVLDNFQNVVDQGTRTEVAQMMEVLSDRSSSTGDLKLVVVGIAEDAQTLLTPSPSVRRRTVDIGVPGMPDDEIKAIFDTGFGLLHLKVDEKLVDHLVFYSDGFPFFAHTIGLNIARVARRANSASISRLQIAAGLHRTLNEVDETYAARMRMAAERGGKVQPKNRILQLLGQSSRRTWTCSDVKQMWHQETGDDPSKLQFIDVAMGSLIKKDSGEVLTRDETSAPYRYRFSDPYFRTYIRLTSELGDISVEREQLFSEPSRPDPLTSFPGA